jgi:hypothetical protein
MKSILFTNSRNEKNILEWVLHHQKLGFDYIYIIDHKSIIPIKNILSVTDPITKNPKYNMKNVFVLRINNSKIIKTDLMKYALQYSIKNKFNWMLYLDSDEFLVLNHTNNVNKFLHNYIPYDQIGINWLLFGSNYRDKLLDGNETIIESYTRSSTKLNSCLKSFINIDHLKYNCLKAILNPHAYILNNMSKSINVNFNKVNPSEPHLYNTLQHFSKVPAFIAHYVYQSYETYINRKINLPRDDTGTFRKLLTKKEFHNSNNEMINTFVKDKYYPSNNTIVSSNLVSKPVSSNLVSKPVTNPVYKLELVTQ